MLKGNNTIKLLVVLVVLVGVFFVLKYTGSNNRSKSFRSELVNIRPDQITKVEIFSPDDTTSLKKTDGSWQVNGSKPADSNAVSTLLKTLNQIEPSRIASRSEDQWKDFQVDESGIRVAAYDGDDKTLDIIIGRFNVEGQRSYYSYVRLAEEIDTYVAKDFMRMSVSTGPEAYRIDNILSLQKDSLERIDFNYLDSAFTLSKGASRWQVDGMPADSASVAKYLNGLRRVSSKKFSETENLSAVFTVIYHLKNGSIEVTSYGNDRISSSANPAESWQDPQASEKLFKGKRYFLKEEN